MVWFRSLFPTTPSAVSFSLLGYMLLTIIGYTSLLFAIFARFAQLSARNFCSLVWTHVESHVPNRRKPDIVDDRVAFYHSFFCKKWDVGITHTVLLVESLYVASNSYTSTQILGSLSPSKQSTLAFRRSQFAEQWWRYFFGGRLEDAIPKLGTSIV